MEKFFALFTYPQEEIKTIEDLAEFNRRHADLELPKGKPPIFIRTVTSVSNDLSM